MVAAARPKRVWISSGNRTSLLNGAIANLKDDDARKARSAWYICRVFAKRLLNAVDAAEVADEALRICGDLRVLVRNRAAIASDRGDYRKVVELIESLPHPMEPDDIGLLAAAFGNLGKHERSTTLWEELLARPAIPDHVRHEALRNYVISLLLEDRKEDANVAVETAISADPGALSPLLIAVIAAERLGDTGERETRLVAAVGAAASGPEYLRLQLGDALMRAERWNDAAEVNAQASHGASDDVYGRRRLQVLYKGGRYDSALGLCDEIDTASGRSPPRPPHHDRSTATSRPATCKRRSIACGSTLRWPKALRPTKSPSNALLQTPKPVRLLHRCCRALT